MDSVWLSFVVVFMAELGDKSQLIALAFSLRHPPLPVIVGITAATALALGLSVLAGGLVGASLPQAAVSIVAGLAFLGFAVWTWRGAEELDEPILPRVPRSTVVAVGVTFFLAELGDKTMLATVTLATTQPWLGTWVGATLGMVTSSVLAIALGRRLGSRMPERVVRTGVSLLFASFGAWLLGRGLFQ